MQTQDTKIFVGIKISEKLQDQLDACNNSAKQYFGVNNREYLSVIDIDYDDYIGKVTEGVTALEDLSNMQMNVKTMLRMICPQFSFTDNAIKIFALTSTPERTYF